ncbi:DMT family transporter [Nguyenibacter sp. L1]|uniref:DMT family transporter n=1 Tax=Nguyenibacter sp. L1 TaxID=3049350 RepID=UPI002B4AAA94|nr:DMT family transporter [Nguyenibacter sp. L1]WRH86680.1 DMT family transporter [Nguyenibacter sp. L1]
MSNHSSQGAALAEYALAMSISGTIGAFAIESGQTAINTVFARCLIGGIFLGGYVFLNRSFSELNLQKKNIWLLPVVASSIVVNWICLFSSYRYASIGMVTIIYHLQPVMVFIGGYFLFGESLSKTRLFALLLAAVGTVLIVLPGGQGVATYDRATLIGYGLAATAAIFYTIATLAGKKLVGVPAPITALCQLALGTVVLSPFVDYSHLPQNRMQWGCLLTLGIVHSAFMYILIYNSYKKLQTSQISVLGYLYPLVALLVDISYFGRTIDIRQIFGCILIAGSGLCASILPIRKLAQKASTV